MPAGFPPAGRWFGLVRQNEPLKVALPVTLPRLSSFTLAVKLVVPAPRLDVADPDHEGLVIAGTNVAENVPLSPFVHEPVVV